MMNSFSLVLIFLAILTVTMVGLVSLMWWLARPKPTRMPDFERGPMAACVRCGHNRPADRRCPQCGLSAVRADHLSRLRATRKTLREFHAAQVVDDATFQRLIKAIQAREATIVAPAARRPAPTTPAESAAARREEILDVLPVEVPPPVRRPSPPPPRPKPEPIVEPKPVAEPKEPSGPRRTWGALLASFMEERHILWGELVGGLLIVGCSVALVRSLWQSLNQIPLFPFLLLSALTVALFGAGRYTLRRWRLESTSRGLLVIALLLVPLDFLVLAGLSPRSAGAPVELAIKLAAIPLFAWLAVRAGALVFDRREGWWLALAVIGAAANALAIARVFDPAGHLWLLPTGCAVLCYALSLGGLLGLRKREAEWPASTAWRLLGFLGLATFPVVLTLGFVPVWAGTNDADVTRVLLGLSPLMVMAGVPIAATGLVIQRRATEALPQFAGTFVALIGMLIHAAAVMLARPEAAIVLAVGLVVAIAWTSAAAIFRMPLAHIPAILGLTVASLGVQHWGEPLEGRNLLTGETGIVFAVLALGLGLVADLLRSRRWWNHGIIHGASAGVLLGAALLLIGVPAEKEPLRAAIVGGGAAAGLLLLSSRWTMPKLGHIGAALIPLATLAALHFALPGRHEIWGVVLAAEAVALGIMPRGWLPAIMLAASLAVVVAVVGGQLALAPHSATLAFLALAAIVQSYHLQNAPWAWLGSAALFAALGHLIYVQPETAPTPVLPIILFVHAALLLPTQVLRRWPNLAVIADRLGESARASSVLAGMVLLVSFIPPWDPSLKTSAGVAAGTAILWLLFAIFDRHPGWYSASQIATAAASILGVIAVLNLKGRIVESLDVLGLVLTVLVIGWAILRLCWRHPLWEAAPWPAVERMLLGGLVVVFVVLALGPLQPGIAAEFGAEATHLAFLLDWTRLAHGEWLLAAALLATIALHLWLVREARGHAAVLSGLMVVGLTIPVLIALSFADQSATASVLRWAMGAAFLLGCLPFWFRGAIARGANRLGIQTGDSQTWIDAKVVPGLRFALLAIAGGVPLGITLVTMVDVTQGRFPPGPLADTIFRQLGFTGSHGIPLALVAIGMVGHALRDRLGGYAFGAGMLTKLLIGGGFLVSLATARQPFDEAAAVSLVVRLTLVAAVWALAWLATARLTGRDWESASPWWGAQWMLAAGGMMGLIATAVLIIGGSRHMPTFLPLFGSWPAWFALAAIGGAAWLRSRFVGPDRSLELIGLASMAVVVLTACIVPPNVATPMRVLMLGWAGSALLWAGLAWRRTGLELGTAVSALTTTLLALRAAAVHEDSYLAAVAVAISAAAGLIVAWLRRRDDWALVAGLGGPLAASLVLVGHYRGFVFEQMFVELLQVNALAGALIAGGWISARRGQMDRREPAWLIQLTLPIVFLIASFVHPMMHLLTKPSTAASPWLIDAGGILAGLAFAAVVMAWALYGTIRRDVWDHLLAAAGLLAGPLLACTIARWDTGNWLAFHALLLTWGGTALAVVAARRPHASEWGIGFSVLFAGLILRAAFDETVRPLDTLLAAGFVAALAAVRPRDDRLVSANLGLGLLALVLSGIVILTDGELGSRLNGPAAVALLAGAAGLLAVVHDLWRPWLTRVGLLLGVVALAELGLAFVPLDAPAVWLHRTVAVLAALAAGTVVYGFAPRWFGRWADLARNLAPYLGLAAALVLVVSVVQQALTFDTITKRTPLSGIEVALLLIATAGLIAASAAFAVRPSLDPFRVPDRWRPGYVYACEVLLVLLFLLLRLNVPGLFPKMQVQTWAFVMIGIAFAGVGLAELFRRFRLDVLAGPIQRTGMFLPLLPLLMFWMKPPVALREVLIDRVPGSQPLLGFFDQIPTDFNSYALLWFLFGLLYAWLAISRQSFRHALLAALAGNAGLWALLYASGIPLIAHPQLWLVPLALIMLVSEQYHHSTLRPELAAGLRYLGLGLLYLSSTADFFLAGLGNSVALPLALALLSVLGVLAGVLLRVRAYLFLGTGFLGLVVFSMIWHAAVGLQQTWLWWASGIVLGVAIIVLFALFEQRRQDVRRIIEELRVWR